LGRPGTIRPRSARAGRRGPADAVAASFDAAPDRLCTVLVSLVRHLHGFIREVGLTQREWEAAVEFLTATGQKCDDTRQEFILLSDVLGVSMLVDAINHRRPAGFASDMKPSA
jgi:hypothetical protein